MAWQSNTINPTTTSPAADITKLTNDLQVLRSVLNGGTDGDVPVGQVAAFGGALLFAGGNAGVGVAPTLYGSGFRTLAVGDSVAGVLDILSGGVSQLRIFGNGTENRLGGITNVPMTIDINSVERGRFDTGGCFLLNRTARSTSVGAIRMENEGRYVSSVSGVSSYSFGANGSNFVIADASSGSTETARLQIDGSGGVFFPSVATTASAANAFLNSGSSPANQLLRSTSSLRYKTDVRDLPAGLRDAVLALRPVVYKSNAEADDQTQDWVGLIAEEVAEVAPRLVHYTRLDEDGPLVPDGVQYDRIAVLLLAVVKQQQATIEALEARVANLESA